MRRCENCGAYLDPGERCDCEEDARVLDKDVVRIMHAVFPGYDQPMHSKVKQPDKYGVMRTPRAEKLLRIAFPDMPVRKPRSDKRTLGNKHTFRLNDADEGRLQTAMERYGYEHLQDFMLMALRWFFTHHGLLQLPAEKETTAS